MSTAWKYIIIEHPHGPGLEIPVLLPPSGLEHKYVALMGRAISAGFCEFADDGAKIFTWGESQSLQLQSRPGRDGEVLRRWFFKNPIPAPERPQATLAI